MTSSQPLDLRLPTPGCYNDPERAGLDAKSVFDGMTEHLFFTLGKLAPTASRQLASAGRYTRVIEPFLLPARSMKPGSWWVKPLWS